MKHLVRAVVSLGMIAALVMGCSSSKVTEPEDDTVADVVPDDTTGGEVSADIPVAPDCEANSDCVDRFPDAGPCQVPVCTATGVCALENTKNYETCDDGDACTTTSVCVDGACEGVVAAVCDDDNPCTNDTCVPATGCVNAPATGASCDDGDPCTEDDACDADGVCEGGGYICDPCTTDSDCAGFEDGDLCNGTLACVDGVCKVDVATRITCDTSGDPACQRNTCVPATGACELQALADETACEDGNVCTQGDTCTAGACGSGAYVCDPCTEAADCTAYAPESACLGEVACIDSQCVIDPDSVVVCDPTGDPCSVAYCDAADGTCKTRDAVAGTPCDDGDACTRTDRCNAGTCMGRALSCDDGDACTTDSCDAATGECVNAAVDCDDENLCTTDSCDAATGECVNTAVDCDDENLCTTDSCDGATGECLNVAVDCDDENLCTADSCDAATGDCQNVATDCDDENPCTTDSCDTATGDCQNVAIDCDDENACTIDSCDTATGDCVNTAVVCDDGLACTTDSCDTATGQCAFIPVVCDDGNLCTTDSCDTADGQCDFVPVVCDDGVACTVDSCIEATGECDFDDSACPETDCDDDLDNDNDGATDCLDSDCENDPACAPQVETNCDDDVDNDADGATDCLDSDCTDDPVCAPPVETNCDDDVDNDEDGATDCLDSDCENEPVCLGCVEDDLEDNDTAETATVVTLNELQAGLVSADGDDDWFVFELCAGGALDIQAAFANADGDIDLGLYDAAGALVAQSASEDDNEQITGTILQAGTYYLVVVMYTAEGCNSYDLTVGFDDTTCGQEICFDEIDNDEDGATDCADEDCVDAPNCAGPVACEATATIACGDEVLGSTTGLESAMAVYSCDPLSAETGGEVVYSFTPTTTGEVQVTLTPADDAVDLDLFVLGPDCSTDACLLAGATVGGEDLVFEVEAGMTYFLVVEGFDGAEGDFTLAVSCFAPSTERLCDDNVDNDVDGLTDCDDDDCEGTPTCLGPQLCTPSGSLTCGGSVTGDTTDGPMDIAFYPCGQFDASGPEVAYTFTPDASGDVTVSVSGLDEGQDLDLYVLGGDCDAAGCVTWGDVDVTFAATAGMTYHVVVDGYLGSASPYTLDVACDIATVERVCDDELDNDDDGATDCADEDCIDDPACAVAETCTADATIACGDSVQGSTIERISALSTYSCITWLMDGPEMVYEFTAEETGVATVQLFGLDERADLDVYVLMDECSTDACVGGGASIGGELFELDVTAGTTYYLVVDGFEGAASDFTLSIDCGVAPERDCADDIDNDEDGATDCDDTDCADAFACTVTGTCTATAAIACEETVEGDTTGQTADIAAYACAPWDESGPEVAYSFTPAADGPVSFSLSGLGDVDLDVVVLTDACEAAACTVAGDRTASIDALAGVTYYVVVDGFEGAEGPFALTATCAAPELEICDDLVDNDLDGLTDCADFDCLADPACEAACDPDEYEPDDDSMTATVLRSGEVQFHSLCPAEDVDWYTFTLAEAAAVTIQTDGEAGDTELTLYDADMTQIGYDDESGNGSFALLATDQLEAGTYYVLVNEYFGDALPAYAIRMSRQTLCVADAVLACGDGAVLGSTTGLTPALNGYGCTTWDESGPEYIYEFAVESDVEVTIQLTGLAEGVDLDLILMVDECGTLNCAAAVDAGGTFLAQAGVTYFVVVDGFEGAEGDFTLNIDCAAPTERVCDDGVDDDLDGATDCDDADCEFDPACAPVQTCTSNATIACGTAAEGSTTGLDALLDTYGCVPWDLSGPEYVYEFTAETTGLAAVTLTGLDADQDLDVYVLSPACAADACVAYGASVGGEDFDFPVEAGVTYYLVVDGFEGAAGNYTLSLDCGDRREVICDDQLDGDEDGLTDCDDPDCAAAPNCDIGSCEPDATIGCDELVEATTVGGPSAMNSYPCQPAWDESGPERVYAFTPAQTQPVTFTLDGLAEGTDLDLFALVDSCDNQSCGLAADRQLGFIAEAGVTYYIVVDGYQGDESAFTLTSACHYEDVERTCGDGIDNDFDELVDCDDPDCADDPACAPQVCQAQDTLACGDVLDGTTFGGRALLADYSCLLWPLSGPEYVYSFAVDSDRTVTLDLEAIGVDLVPDLDVVVLAETCDAAACEAAASTETNPETLTFDAMAGVTYYVVVDGFDGAAGDYVLSATCADGLVETVCDDQLDNDGDGATDCDDLDCEGAPGCEVPCVEDDYEDNDDQASALPVLDGDEIAGAVCGDEDWYVIDVPAGCTVTGDLQFLHADGDLDMGLFDADGNSVDTSGSGSDNELVEYASVDGGAYAFRIFGYNGATNPSYVLYPTIDCGETQCADNVDNDEDGATDCLDSDCEGHPSCARCEATATLACGDEVTGTNEGGATSIERYTCATWNESGPEVVYSFTPDTDDSITAAISGMSADLDLFILEANCVSGRCIAGGGDSRTTAVTAGVTYYIVVDGYNGAVSDYTLTLDCGSQGPEDCTNGVDDNFDGLTDCDDADCVDAPACVGQFSCDNPAPIPGPGLYLGNNTGLADNFDGTCQSNTGSEAVWQLTTGIDTTVCVDLSQSSYDTVLYVTAECVAGAEQIVCDDDTVGTRSVVQFDATADTPYFVFVDAYSTRTGDYVMDVRFAPCDAVEVCDVEGDEDGDLLADCDDPDCAAFPACVVEICDNLIDDDGDEAIDCDDADCALAPVCIVEICDNQIDDDGDDLIDCADDECAGVPPCPCLPDEFEPNDADMDAATILLDETLALSICPAGDVDWFTFTLEEARDITLETAGATGDTTLELFDEGMNSLAFDDDIDFLGGNAFSRITTTLEPGTYYAVVHEFDDNAAIHAYTLSLYGCAVDAYEADDVVEAATTLDGELQSHSICPANDVDWYTFTLDGLADVRITTTGPAIDGPAGDTIMVLFDANGTEIASNDDVLGSLYAALWLADVPAGTYSVAVLGIDELNAVPAYDITFETTVLACPGDDQYEDNDTLLTGTVLEGSSVLRAVRCAADDDYYAIDLEAGCQITADLLFAHADGDLDLALLNSQNGLVLASTSEDDNEQVSVTVEEAGRYYLRVYFGENRYTLAVDVACAVPEVCDDGIDNDLDELVDCFDPDCDLDPACPDDQYEDNDTQQTATPGLMSADDLVSIYNDLDWFAYDVCADGTITVDIYFVDAEGDLDLYLHDADGGLIVSSPSSTDNESLTWTNDTGANAPVLVRVRNWSIDAITPYAMLVEIDCPEVCDNDLDDDLDGATDCFDFDCVGDPACPPLPPVGYAAIQHPTDPVIVPADEPLPIIFGRVWVEGVTPGPGPGFGIRGQLGWGPDGSMPMANDSWTWIEGVYEGDLDGNDDQFMAIPEGIRVGLWDYAWRFSTDNGATWVYGDLFPGGSADEYSPDTTGSIQIQGPEDCGNLVDDDGDQAIDCDDSDCTNDPFCGGGPTEGELRLADGVTIYDGRLEIYHDGVWGTVCDDAFDILDAEVACIQLGFTGAAAVDFTVAPGVEPTWLDQLECTGTELLLADCPANDWGVEDCGHSEDTGVVCLAPGECRTADHCAAGEACAGGVCVVPAVEDCTDEIDNDLDGLTDCADSIDCGDHPSCAGLPTEGDLRLVGGADMYEGRIEVYHAGVWGTVCDDNWESFSDPVVALANGDVACRQLGFAGALAVDIGVPIGVDPTWLDNVSCVGTELTLADCPNNGWGVENCGHSEDVGVECAAPGECRLDEHCPAGETCDAGACTGGGGPAYTCADPGLFTGALQLGTTEGMANNLNPMSCGDVVASGPETVWQWTPETAGTYCIDTFPTPFDSVLYVREDCAAGPDVACNDDSPYAAGLHSTVAFAATAGATYYVIVDGLDDTEFGSYDLAISPGPCAIETEVCDDLIDNDGDGAADCLDTDCETDPACAPPAPNPLFSTYLEGSSNNKALEIVNFTGAAPLALADCQVELSFNGGSSTGSIQLDAAVTLNAGEVFVVCNSAFALGVPDDLCDQYSGSLSFNGDDAVSLVCGGTTYDVIGQVGFDPGAGWTANGVSTANMTMYRGCDITAGDVDGTDVFDPSVEFFSAPQNDIAGLGVWPYCGAP